MKTRPRIDLAILAVLDSGPLHGYAIYATIRSYQKDLIQQPSHLYPKLYALNEDGYVTSREVKHQGDTQIVYTITPQGLNHLKTLREELSNYLWVTRKAVQVDSTKLQTTPARRPSDHRPRPPIDVPLPARTNGPRTPDSPGAKAGPRTGQRGRTP